MAAMSCEDEIFRSKKIIKEQFNLCGFKIEKEVTDLYLGEKGLRKLPDLTQFKILSYLWLNNNKIENLAFLKHNSCMAELYLNNNEIRTIEGALKHMRSLKVLLLHNNQLKNLETSVKELHRMRSLQTLSFFKGKQKGKQNKSSSLQRGRCPLLSNPALQCLDAKGVLGISWMSFPVYNGWLTKTAFLEHPEIRHCKDLFNNPLSQDPRYRFYVIYHIPSVTLLDRKDVTGKERESALHIYNHEKTLVLQSIGFGKSVDVPLLPKPRFSLTPTKVLCLPPGCEFGNHLVKIPFENPEDAVLVRAMQRSLMEFSTVDWEKMPTSEERRLGSHPEKRPEKLTIRFR